MKTLIRCRVLQRLIRACAVVMNAVSEDRELDFAFHLNPFCILIYFVAARFVFWNKVLFKPKNIRFHADSAFSQAVISCRPTAVPFLRVPVQYFSRWLLKLFMGPPVIFAVAAQLRRKVFKAGGTGPDQIPCVTVSNLVLFSCKGCCIFG